MTFASKMMNSSDKAVGKQPPFSRNIEGRMSCSAEKQVTNKFLKGNDLKSSNGGNPLKPICKPHRPYGASRMIEQLTRRFRH